MSGFFPVIFFRIHLLFSVYAILHSVLPACFLYQWCRLLSGALWVSLVYAPFMHAGALWVSFAYDL